MKSPLCWLCKMVKVAYSKGKAWPLTALHFSVWSLLVKTYSY